MSGFGERLRRQREMRGVSLEEISQSTKIGTRSLKAIEGEDFEKLPGGIFNKGFVRAYARFLGLDEEQIVSDFEEAWDAYEAARTPQVLEVSDEGTKTSTPRSVWVAVLVLLIVAAAAAGWYGVLRMRAEQPIPPTSETATAPSAPASTTTPQISPAVATPEASSSAVQNGKESEPSGGARPPQELKRAASSGLPELKPSGPPASSPTKAPAPIRLQVFAREDSWLSVIADGKDLGQGILSAQKTRSIHAQKEVRLKVGNVGGVEISFNGQPVDVDGQPKEVKELIFTVEGLQR